MTDMIKVLIGFVLGVIIGVFGILLYQQSTGNVVTTDDVSESVNEGMQTTSQIASDAARAVTPDWRVDLTEQNGSGFNGYAIFNEENGQTRVIVSLTADNIGSMYPDQPAHIHLGTCPTPGAVEYPLNNLKNGSSETVINTTIDNLKSKLPLALNVHKSSTESSIYTVCGDLK